MRRHFMPRLLAIAVAAGAALSLASASFASDPPRWTVRAGPQWITATGDEAGDLTFAPPLAEGESREKAVTDDFGFGLEVEYRLNRRWGVEATVHAGDLGAELTLDTPVGRSTDEQDIGFLAATVGVNFHLTPGKRTDFYVGGFGQQSDYDDVRHQFPGLGRAADLTFDEAVGWGVKIGADVELRAESPWILGFSARHLREPLDVKPVLASVFVGYRR